MDKETLELLTDLYEHLKTISNITTIFDVNILETEKFIKDLAINESDFKIVYSNFKTTIIYLVEYVYKNNSNKSNKIIIESDYYDIFLLIQDNNFPTIDKFTFLEKILLVKLQCLSVMLSVNSTIRKPLSKLIDNKLNLLYKQEGQIFWRGHTKSSYNLLPSIYRTYADPYNIKFDSLVLFNEYFKNGLIEKYNKIFKFSTIDTEFCAFMQHSCSFSPFLDITSDLKIALSFATHRDSEPRTYSNSNAALYRFIFNEKVEEVNSVDLRLIQNMILNDKLGPFSYVGYGNNEKMLYMATPSDFNPEVKLITGNSNDRMKYQKGAFIYFNHVFIVNHVILLPYKIGSIEKFLISFDRNEDLNKFFINDYISQNFPEFSYDHLMNPYKYFEE